MSVTPWYILFSMCLGPVVFGQNLYNDYFGRGNRIGNTVDIIGSGRRLITGYNPFSTGRLGSLDDSREVLGSTLNPRSSFLRRPAVTSPYSLSRLGTRSRVLNDSGERGSNWSNIFSRLNRRRYLRRGGDSSEEKIGGRFNRYNRRRMGGDSSEERGRGILNRFYRRRRGGDSSEERGRGLFSRINRRGRLGGNSSEERGRGRLYSRFNRRRWNDSSEERRGGFRGLYSRYNRRWGDDSGERRGRWGRFWRRGSDENSGERFFRRGRRFSTRSPYRDLNDSDERGLFSRGRRNYRSVISRLRSPYSYSRNNYNWRNRLSLFNNNWMG